MKYRQIIITAVIGIMTFTLGTVTGFAIRTAQRTDEQNTMLLSSGAENTDNALQLAEAMQTEVLVRINDGNVEWYDGTRWNTASSVEELEMNDKYAATDAARVELEEQIKSEKLAESLQTQSGAEEIQNENKIFIVGTKQNAITSKETKQAQQKASASKDSQPQSTQPAQAATSSAASVNDNSSGDGGSSGDSGSSGGGSSDDGGSSGGGGSSDGGSSDSGGSSDDGGSSESGDGENMEWCIDYL
jgi:uncharacterized membrane protein YgcG